MRGSEGGQRGVVRGVGDFSVTTGKRVDREWMFSNISAGRTVPEVIAVAVTFRAAMWMQVTRNSSRRCPVLSSRVQGSLLDMLPPSHLQPMQALSPVFTANMPTVSQGSPEKQNQYGHTCLSQKYTHICDLL